MRLNEQHQLISQGLRWQATPYVPFLAVATILALFLSSSRQECQEDATAFVRTSQAKSSPNRKKISSNTAPTAPTLSTRFISAAKNSQSAILSAVFSNRLTISPPKRCFISLQTMYRLGSDVALFLLKRYDVIVLISARKLSFLSFFSHLMKKTKSSHRLYPFLCIFAHK